MRKNRVVTLGLLLISIFMVGCGVDNKEVDPKTKFTDESATMGVGEIGKEKFITVDIEYEGLVDVVLKEFDNIVFEGKLHGGNDENFKLYSLAKCEKEKSYDYTLEVSKDKKIIVKNLVYRNIGDAVEESDEIIGEEQYEKWSDKGVEYQKNEEVIYEGRTYKCLQPHKSQITWNPKDAVSLWEEFKIESKRCN